MSSWAGGLEWFGFGIPAVPADTSWGCSTLDTSTDELILDFWLKQTGSNQTLDDQLWCDKGLADRLWCDETLEDHLRHKDSLEDQMKLVETLENQLRCVETLEDQLKCDETLEDQLRPEMYSNEVELLHYCT